MWIVDVDMHIVDKIYRRKNNKILNKYGILTASYLKTIISCLF